jgi:hypothetical protein
MWKGENNNYFEIYFEKFFWWLKNGLKKKILRIKKDVYFFVENVDFPIILGKNPFV